MSKIKHTKNKIKVINKTKISLVAICFLLLSFCMFKTFADSNNILALTELTRTGDYKNAISSDNQNGVMTSNGITLTISKNNNDILKKGEALKINATSSSGIKRIEGIMYDAKTNKIVSSNFYTDNSMSEKNAILSIKAPDTPIERLLLRVNVYDKNAGANFERVFAMDSSLVTIYSKSLSSNMIAGSNLEFYADSSYSSVPIKYLSYELYEGSRLSDKGTYKLSNDEYKITEDGLISYNKNYVKEGNGIFSNVYNNSRLTCQIKLPSKNSSMRIVIKASDILGYEKTKDVSFNLKNTNITFSVDDKSSSIKVGTKINCKAKSSDNFGLAKLEAIFYDKDNLVISKDYSLSSYSYGDGTLSIDAAIPDKEEVSLLLVCEDIAGNKKEYGPIKYKVSYNEFDVEPIFRLSSEPKLIGSSEMVAVTSNSGIAFTQLEVKICDKNGNIIEDSDGSKKISQISSAASRDTLEVQINYPKKPVEEAYFVFSARDAHGNYYNGGSDFKSMSSVYKKGPIKIYNNKIDISASPETGLLNSNSDVKLTAKADVSKYPIKEIEYVYYDNDIRSDKLKQGTTFKNGLNEASFIFIDGIKTGYVKIERETKNNSIIKITPVCDSLVKDGFILYLTKPAYNGCMFTMNAYYARKEKATDASLVSESSYYDEKTGMMVLGYDKVQTSGVIARAEIKGPIKNSDSILLKVIARDTNGETKTSYFNYYQNNELANITCYPERGNVDSNSYIKVVATPGDEGISIKSLSYELKDKDTNEIIMQGTTTSINHKGEIEHDILLKDECKNKNISLQINCVDSNSNVSRNNFLYKVNEGNSDIDFDKMISNISMDDPNYKYIAGRLLGGVNEYVIEYKDVNGQNQVAVLNNQKARLENYFCTNVKELELLNITNINKALEKNNYPKVLNLKDINKLYTRLNLYFTLTCEKINDNTNTKNNVTNNTSNTESNYVDITRKFVVTYNDSNYKLIKNHTLNLGNGANIGEVLDLDMIGEILKKAQIQNIESIDLNNLGPNDKIIKVYNPDKLSANNLPSKDMNVEIKFNDSYIKGKDKLTSSDLVNEKAFNITPNKLVNEAHILLNRYVLENYSLKLDDISVHKNHTYDFDELTGVVTEHCSDSCIIYPMNKTITMYYGANKEKEVISQNITYKTSYKYLANDNTWQDADSQVPAKLNEKGETNIKIVASFEPSSLMEETSKKASTLGLTNGDYSVEINKAEYPNDGEVKAFEKESESRWVKLERDIVSEEKGPQVKINMSRYENSFFYNSNKGRYERSSDRGNQIKVTVEDTYPLKDIKVSYKREQDSDYINNKTLFNFTEENNITNKEVVVDLPDSVMKNGGLVEVKIVASNYNNETSSGRVRVVGEAASRVLKLFINTTKGTEPLPLIQGKSVSLIKTDGTINEEVAKKIGEGKTSNMDTNPSAFKITKVNDVKWVYDSKSYQTNAMPLYYNSANDTIGLGYGMSFSLDTVGYGTDSFKKDNIDYNDTLIVNFKFFAKLDGVNYTEVIPFEEKNGTYVVSPFKEKYRQLRMISDPSINTSDVSGLNNIVVSGNNCTWNFSYYMPSNIRFKAKNDTEGSFRDINELLVQMDMELYKYYSKNNEDNTYIKDGSQKDSRHLYSLRETKWNDKLDITNIQGIATKSAKVKLKDIVETNRGLVFWYDKAKDATFDLNGQRYN